MVCRLYTIHSRNSIHSPDILPDTVSTSTLTVQSSVTVIAGPTTPSSSTTSTSGLAGFIMQGLDDASSSSSSIPTKSTNSDAQTNNVTTRADWRACQTSQVSWSEAWTSAFDPKVVTNSTTYTSTMDTITFNVTFGNADVYTTIDGIPHAHGELKATSTSQSVGTYIEYTPRVWTSTTSRSAAFANPSPNCTIGTSKCIDLWETYLDDQGLPTMIDNVTEPAITPVPTDRPRCSVGDISLSCAPEKTRCIISANKVDLFYWPAPTAAPNASQASNVTTTVFRNITMTSPSVYLIFDHLQALTSGVQMETCSFSSPLGATSTATYLGPAASQGFIGGPYTDAVVSLDPTSLKSLVRDLGPGINTASVVSEIAHGGPDYYHWINYVLGSGMNYNYYGGYGTNVTALPVDFSDIEVPPAEAYYLNINGPPGCNRMGDHPQCSTIYDGAYRAQLLVPDQVRTLRPEWATCYDPLYGAYDPPIALTPAGTIAKPSSGPEQETKPPVALTPETTINKPAPGPTVSKQPKETTPKNDPSPDPTPKPDLPKPSDSPSPTGETPNDSPSKGSTAQPENASEPDKNDPSPEDSSNDQTNNSEEDNAEGPTKTGDTPNTSPSSDGNSNANDSPSTGSAPNDKGGDSDAGDSNHAAEIVAAGILGAAKESNAANNENSGDSAGNGVSHTENGQGSSNESSDSGNSSGSTGSGSSGGGDSSSGNSGSHSSEGSDDDSGSSQGAGSETGSDSSASNNNNDGSPTNNEPPEQVISIGGAKHTVAAHNGVPILDGSALPADGSPVTIDGQTVSAADGNVIIGTQTVPVPTGSAEGSGDSPAAVFLADGQEVTALPGRSSGIAVIDGTTISVGGSGMTAHGAHVSAAPDGIVVDGSTIAFEAAPTTSGDGVVLTLGSDVIATASGISSGVFAVGSVTLTAGGPDATISGHTISAASSGIVIDGSSTAIDPGATKDGSPDDSETYVNLNDTYVDKRTFPSSECDINPCLVFVTVWRVVTEFDKNISLVRDTNKHICHRLDKVCQPSASKRKLRQDNVRAGRVSKSSAAANTTRIEQKLDDLASMLASNEIGLSANRGETMTVESQHTEITDAEAEASIALFNTRMLKFFPYVYIPPSKSIQHLRATRPFLVLCMAAVSTRPLNWQREIFAGVRDMLAQRLIKTSEPSIDLLLGLLTVLGWLSCLPPPSVDNIKLTASVFARLAASVVSDLGLNQSMQNDPPHLRCFHMFHTHHCTKSNQVEPTIEECRAVLAWFVMSSSLVRPDPVRWTYQMGKCLEALEQRQESPLDAVLVNQARICRVVEKANLSVLFHATFEASREGEPLPTIYTRSMQAELDRLRQDLPITLQSNVVLRAFHNAANLQIRCTAISWTSLESKGEPNVAQLQNIAACVDLVQALFDNFFSIPPGDIIGVSFPMYTQLRLGLGMLFCLSTLDCPGWDKAEVRRQVDTLNVIDRMIETFEEAVSSYTTESGDDHGEDGALLRVPAHLRMMRTAWAAKLERCEDQAVPFAPTPESGAEMGMAEMPSLDDFLDMNWLMSAI
ncbi:hypothetical protein Q7P37_005565 [Cladosporium fusiforme]